MSICSTVGYRIRLDARVSAATRLTFCTTGILLRRLTTDTALEGVTHVIVDEVHERGLVCYYLSLHYVLQSVVLGS
jgi:HrpA-like RNA helicase